MRFTEGLITCLSTVDNEAPASSNTCATSLLPLNAAMCRGRSCFNYVIELNQKILILKGFVTKRFFYVMMTTELFIKYMWIVMPLPPVTSVSHLCGHSMLPCVEVSHPKTINIKQYSSTDNFSYQTRRARSCFNYVIELNQKMLMFKTFVTKNDCLCDDDN
jgi:hypothetical protein